MPTMRLKYKFEISFSDEYTNRYSTTTRMIDWNYDVEVDENVFVDFLFETKKIEENPQGWAIVKKVVKYMIDSYNCDNDDDFYDYLYKKHYDEAQEEFERYMK